jgi:hypothetical protein
MLFAGVSFEFTIQSDFKWKHLVSTLPVKEWMIDNFFNIFLETVVAEFTMKTSLTNINQVKQQRCDWPTVRLMDYFTFVK